MAGRPWHHLQACAMAMCGGRHMCGNRPVVRIRCVLQMQCERFWLVNIRKPNYVE